MKNFNHIHYLPALEQRPGTGKHTQHIKTLFMQLPKLFMKWVCLFLLLVTGSNAVAQNPYPNAGDHSVCLNATEPYGVALNTGSTYAWSITPVAGGNGTITAGATPNLITVTWTSAGTATLSVVETNAQGCVGDPVNILVTINPLPTVTVNSSTICAGTSATITATPGTAGTYNYAWTVPAGATNPGNTASFTSNIAGTYSVVITSTTSNCASASASGTVTIAAAPTLVINNPAPQCAPATVDLTAPAITAGSTAGLTFTYWTDAAATVPYATPAAATTGTYYIKGTLGSGCFDIQPVTVTINPVPVLVVNNPAAACAPATVDLTAAAITAGTTAGVTLTYWTDAAATVPYATPAAATSGTYYIKATLPGGCSDIKPVTVTVNPLPVPIITGPSPVCQSTNGSTETYSTPNVAGNTYNWVVTGGTISSGQGTSQVTVTWATPGSGTVSVTETITATGCSANAIKTVTITPRPVTSVITHN